jgi:hypothetical protein
VVNEDILIWAIEYEFCLFQADTLLDSIMDQDKDPQMIPHIDTINSVSWSKNNYRILPWVMYHFVADE